MTMKVLQWNDLLDLGSIPDEIYEGIEDTQLCIPQDNLKDLACLWELDNSYVNQWTLFPQQRKEEEEEDNSSNGRESDESSCRENDVDSFRQIPGKRRSKGLRLGRRTWSLDYPLLPPGGSRALAVKKRCCSHCKAEKTPQWRMGPLGPKTLCNACGVRYRAGRLVPEYRPAASPTFQSHKHSNSHRKIMTMMKERLQ